jgi:hypothetical protein
MIKQHDVSGPQSPGGTTVSSPVSRIVSPQPTGQAMYGPGVGMGGQGGHIDHHEGVPELDGGRRD